MRTSVLLVALAFVALDATAQAMPGRGRPGGREMGSPREREPRNENPATASATDPYGALERELPSLKVDLLIRGDQLEPWRVVERDIRDIAEMERARRRHLLALKGSDKPASALTFVASLAEDDRLKAEASVELKRHLEALYAALDDTQRATLDRRVIQSQVEPLGSERGRTPSR